jgi:thioredoxin reductase (NADPH)
MVSGMAESRFDYYVLKPARPGEEQFHRLISEFLYEWAQTRSPAESEITLVGGEWSPRTHELRSLLARNGVPHAFVEDDCERGRALLERAGRTRAEGPIAMVRDGPTLINPTEIELAEAFGVNTQLGDEREFDVVVVGAGPAGLAAAVYAASEGLRTFVVEREFIGGQAGSSSLIRNYLGFSRGVGGGELAQRAYQQAWLFGARSQVAHRAVALEPGERGFVVRTADDGAEVSARAVVLALGVEYRKLDAPGCVDLEGAGIYYGASMSEAQAFAGEEVYVVGGGNSAGQAALHLARYARRVTILVRTASLSSSMSHYLIDTIGNTPNVVVRYAAEVTAAHGEGRLERLQLLDRESGKTETVDAAALVVLIGAMPHTAWLPDEIARDDWGYVVTGPDAGAGRPLETSLPGVFAAGDVRAGSVKRVAAAVGDGALAVTGVHAYLDEVSSQSPARS